MAVTEAQLLRLTVRVHEAGADPAVWPLFLEDYARLIAADVAVVQRHNFSEHRSTLLATAGLSSKFTEPYNAHYSRVNIWRERGRHLYVAGCVFFDEEACPRALLKRSEFYNDYLVPIHGTRCLTGVIACAAGEAYTLTALRDERQQPWTDAEQHIVDLLLPHVIRAHLTRQRLETLETGAAVLDTLPYGVTLIAADQHVVWGNQAAEAIFRAGDGLSLRRGALAAADSDSDAALQKAIRDAILVGESLDCPTAVAVSRPSSRRAYHVTVAPLRRTFQQFTGMSAIVGIVFIVNPEQHWPIGTYVLKQLYGLTPKEAALALKLAEGRTVREAADQLGIRYETARTHLRRVLSKTDTSRQAELVNLLAHLSQHSSIAR